MNIIRTLFWSGSMLALCAGPAFAGVNVSSPSNGAVVSSPFTLSAWASNCSSQPIIAMGYSFDSSSSVTTIYASSIDTPVSASPGGHTLHVKAWGKKGATCVTDVSFTVQQNTVVDALAVPAQAISVSSIESLSNWTGDNDSGASGTSTGSTSLVTSPSLFGSTRQFNVSFRNSGSERFYVSFGDDATSTNFIYDVYVYLNNTSSKIANLEFDLNQVMTNGQTVIYGVQCDGWTNTWDYTANAGTPTAPVDVWVHTRQSCNPRTWSINTWHHVQIAYSRDNNGVVTYKTIALDGRSMPINATTLSSFALGWDPTLLTNFQIDGYGNSGSATAFLDNLTIYRW